VSDTVPEQRLRKGIFARLSVMMLLEYMTYGSWWATVGLVLSSRGMGAIVGITFSFAAIAALISPMFAGAIADRFVASEKLMAILHGVGGVILLAITPIINAGNGMLVVAVVFVYMLFFQPTSSLVNSITFANTPRKSNAYSYIRAFGTLGWIIMGLFIGQLGLSDSPSIFLIGAVMSFILAAYCLTLPKTPPAQTGARFKLGDLVGSGAFPLFRSRSFAILVVCMLLVSVPISIYNAYGSTYLQAAGVPNVASVMTIGQAAEIVCLVLVPLVLRRFTIKVVLGAGLICWVIRAVLFLSMTEGNLWLAIAVVALHGVCNDFFVMAAFIYVDQVARKQIRAQAQALMLFVSLGLGNTIGSLVAGEFYNAFVGDSTEIGDWAPLWYLTLGLTALAGVLFFTFFRAPHQNEIMDDDEEPTPVDPSDTPHPTPA
jgi:nucleoside transporter